MTFSCHFSQLLSFSDLECHPRWHFIGTSESYVSTCIVYFSILIWQILKNIYNPVLCFMLKFFSIYDEDIMWLSFHSQYFYVSLYNSKLILYSGFSYQFLITTLLGILVKFLHFYTFIFLFLYSCEVSLSFLSFSLQTIFNILLANQSNQSVHNNHCHNL